jgi:hypothetical protein
MPGRTRTRCGAAAFGNNGRATHDVGPPRGGFPLLRCLARVLKPLQAPVEVVDGGKTVFKPLQAPVEVVNGGKKIVQPGPDLLDVEFTFAEDFVQLLNDLTGLGSVGHGTNVSPADRRLKPWAPYLDVPFQPGSSGP